MTNDTAGGADPRRAISPRASHVARARGRGCHAALFGTRGRAACVVAAFMLLIAGTLVEAGQTCAVITASDGVAERGVADLLEMRLAADEAFTLVDRANLKAVLTEQTLSAAFSAEGVGARVKLGRLIKADLLVLLRERKGEKATAIDIAVASTDRGLRLASDVVPWEPGRVEDIVNQFMTGVRRAGDLAQQPDLHLFAVPPFESRELTFDNVHQQRGYARLVEECLTGLPNVAVVEWAEANALLREVALTGSPVERSLPYYVIGSFRTTKNDSGARVHFDLELRQGSKVIANVSQDSLSEVETGPVLQHAVDELLAGVVDTSGAPPDAAAEIDLLLSRSSVFQALGAWDEAFPLYEAALVLDPGHREVRLRVFFDRVEMVRSTLGLPSRGASSLRTRMQAMEAALDALDELIQRRLVDRRVVTEAGYLQTHGHLSGYEHSAGANSELVTRLREYCRRRGRLFLAIVKNQPAQPSLAASERRAAARSLTNCSRLAAHLDAEEAFEVLFELICVLDDQPGTEDVQLTALQALQSFWSRMDASQQERISNLETSSSKRVRTAARIGRILWSIQDPETYQQATDEIRSLVPEESLPKHLEMRAMHEAKAQLDDVTEEQRREASIQDVSVPKLTPLMLGDRPWPATRAWLTCSADLECAATTQGLWQIAGPGVVKVLDPIQAEELAWDGRYLWALGEGKIIVLHPGRGRIAEFDARGAQDVAAAGPGHACAVAWVMSDKRAYRTWIMRLHVDESPTGEIIPTSELVFEARDQPGLYWRDVDPLKFAYPLSRILTFVPRDDENAQFVIPWLDLRSCLPVRSGALRLAQCRWPGYLVCVQDENTFFVADSRVGHNRQWQAVYRADDPDDELNMLVDLGVRTCRAEGSWRGMYFRAGLVYEGHLHLLTSDPQLNPNWIAINLKTLQTSVLVSEFPGEFRCCALQLHPSNHYGVVLVRCESVPYQVSLPPAEQWPSYDRVVGATRIPDDEAREFLKKW